MMTRWYNASTHQIAPAECQWRKRKLDMSIFVQTLGAKKLAGEVPGMIELETVRAKPA